MVFRFTEEANILLKAYKENSDLLVGVADGSLVSGLKDTVDTPKVYQMYRENPADSEVEFVETKPTVRHPESDDFITAMPDGGSSVNVQLLLSKLQKLQRIKSDLYQLLSRSKDTKREVQDAMSLEQLTKKREKIFQIDLDVQLVLNSLKDLVQTYALNKKLCFESSTISPSFSRTAFVKFVTSKSSEDFDFQFCIDSKTIDGRTEADGGL
ncbi:hypothetical protein JTE90_001438 [Oedothorax gibbosus]|uniref:Uncharacterized protein n=1 Tax=Oedothorax gibbosus TaxID=931172 RepID=A0AAV6V2C6_9ARAC|nr:hypothetical protein JTE90_001438 [Oedothorax gibbosus]